MQELLRLEQLAERERAHRRAGRLHVAGVDEAGRGPLAGPVVAAACIIPEGLYFAGVNDSKQVTAQRREALFEQLTQDSRISYGIGCVDAGEIDRINIYQATLVAMQQAIAALTPQPDMLLVDGMPLVHPSIPSQKIIKGDSLCYCIAAASIIAKVYRDRLMVAYHQRWPIYGFDRHKGYGTEAHRHALLAEGPCEIHRLSFTLQPTT